MKALAAALVLLPALAGAAGRVKPLHPPLPGLWELSIREGSSEKGNLPTEVTQRECLGPEVGDAPGQPSAEPIGDREEEDDCRVLRSQRQGDTVRFAVACPGPVATRTEGYVTVHADRVLSRATTTISSPGEADAKVWHEFTARRLGDCPSAEVR